MSDFFAATEENKKFARKKLKENGWYDGNTWTSRDPDYESAEHLIGKTAVADHMDEGVIKFEIFDAYKHPDGRFIVRAARHIDVKYGGHWKQLKRIEE